ncbi:hypothetical protein LguiB_035955 [Lonicera macranthoides]
MRKLEAQLAYGLPPQLNPGEYEPKIRDELKSAVSLRDYAGILSRELRDMQIYELKKGLARKTFQFNCLISEPQLESILDLSPYRDIREAAYDFIEEKDQIYISKENPGIRHCIVSNDVFCMGCSKTVFAILRGRVLILKLTNNFFRGDSL